MKAISFWKKLLFTLFGCLIFLAILEFGLRIGGQIFLSLQEHRNEISLKQKDSCRILCLGESTTALGGNYSYPRQLEKILNQSKDINKKFTVINKGIPAINTGLLLLQLQDNLDKYKPDIVITMIGINDKLGEIRNKEDNYFTSFRVYKLAKFIYSSLSNKGHKPKDVQDIAVALSDAQLESLQVMEKDLKKKIESNPQEYELYTDLGICYLDQGKYFESEKSLKQAVAMNPKSMRAYFELGVCLQKQGKYQESEKVFVRAIEISEDNWMPYVQLSACYRSQRKYEQSRQILEEAIEKHPEVHWLFSELGMVCKEQGKTEQAKLFLQKAIELNQKKDHVWPYIELGRLYRSEGRNDEAKEMIKQAILIDPKNKWAKFETDGFNSNQVRLESNSPVTAYNYQKIAKMIADRGIRHLCVQYPMRKVSDLERILKSYRKNIVFIDNKLVLKEAVEKDGYKEYFTDRFAGDFGHCTAKGNRLLAENIAKFIIDIMD
ncbi:MAG: tetratricopeptide repeat protein [PVC group bacterium]|nr:tetratricopeptide repeat protein [PVC group bacterium]